MSDLNQRADRRPWFGLLVRVGLAGVWLYAGWTKIGDPNSSVRSVRAYRLLPEAIVPTVGYGLPILEILIGLLLLAGIFVRAAAVVSVVLLLMFITGIAWAWSHGLAIDCGCFGGGGEIAPDQTQYPQEIARDAGFLVLAGFLIRFPLTALSLDRKLGLVASQPA